VVSLLRRIPAYAGRRRAACYRELAVLLRAGIRVDRALEILAEKRFGGVTPSAWESTLAGVRGGRPFHESLSLQPWPIPAAEQAALRAAEATGRLDLVLDRLADRLIHRTGLAVQFALRLAYPAALLHLTVLVVALMLFPGYPGKALAVALVVAGLGDALLFALGLGFLRWTQQSAAAERLPVLGPLLRFTAQRQFLEALSLLHGAGLTMTDAHGQATAAVTRSASRSAFARAGASLAAGGLLSQGLAATGVLDPEILGVLHNGEIAGEIEGAAARGAALMEQREANSLALLSRTAVGVIYALAASVVAVTAYQFYSGYYHRLTRF
jgi:general secretion pathway protein F